MVLDVLREEFDRIYVTADTHFGHDNVIKYCQRPFTDVNHMNEEMIKRWNEKVPTDALVFHLGDFGFKSYRKEKGAKELLLGLNGEIVLIRGNHDELMEEAAVKQFSAVFDYLEVRCKELHINICMFHFPIASWRWKEASHLTSYHLHGHCHGTLMKNQPELYKSKKMFDVGVDVHDFSPVKLTELVQI